LETVSYLFFILTIQAFLLVADSWNISYLLGYCVGMMSPIHQVPVYADLLYEESMINQQEWLYMKKQEVQITALIKSGQYVAAFNIFDELLNGDFFPYPTYYTNHTGLTDYFNLQQPQYFANNWMNFINQPAVRKAIHVGDHPFNPQNSTVEFYLLNDWQLYNSAYTVNCEFCSCIDSLQHIADPSEPLLLRLGNSSSIEQKWRSGFIVPRLPSISSSQAPL
jgi:hypothetical protein